MSAEEKRLEVWAFLFGFKTQDQVDRLRSCLEKNEIKVFIVRYLEDVRILKTLSQGLETEENLERVEVVS